MKLHFDLKEAKHEFVILLGQTGGGKSSIANAWEKSFLVNLLI